MKILKNWISILLLLFTCGIFISQSNIIYVPADTNSIQTAIDLANEGDTILVSDGIYNENINFNGKAITVSSLLLTDGDTSHISNTIIDGSRAPDPENASVVTFRSGEDTSSVLNGFTITGGGGTYYTGEFPMWAGAGIFILSGAMVSNNHIINNSLNYNGSSGAGIYINSKYPVPESGRIVIIKNNLIKNNLLSGYSLVAGAGMALWGSAYTLISNNTFMANRVENVNPIDENVGGGALYIADQSPVIINNVFSGNEAEFGGAVNAWGRKTGSNLRLINNTFTENNASIKGGGIYINHGHCTSLNNIFWGNTAPFDPDIFYRGDLNISYSITQGVFPGEGNMQTDPLFENETYHLSDASPAVDAGNPETRFHDKEDKGNPGFPLWPAKGGLRADIGAFGGNDTVYVKKEAYMVRKNFLYRKFNNMYYRFAYPSDYDSTTVYPLTIVLHGSANSGTDNEKQLYEGLPWRANAEYFGYNEFTILPQAPPNTSGWSNNDNLITVYELIKNTIDNFPVDTTKIVITGWSQGGGGVKSLISMYPRLFSAAIPVSGIGGGSGNIKHIPVWANHGGADGNVSPGISRNFIRGFENTGLTAIYTETSSENEISEAIDNNARLFYSEFEGAGHYILKQAYENFFLFDWLKKQSRPLIWPENTVTDKRFLKIKEDSVLVSTFFSNPNSLQYEHRLIVENFSKKVLRNITLYDDGQHGDSLSEDGIWGNYISPVQNYDNYRIGIEVRNLDTESIFYFNDLSSFTTKGPVTLDHFTLTSGENELVPGNTYGIQLYLKNNSETVTVRNLKINLIPTDNCLSGKVLTRNIDSLAAGEVKAHNGNFNISLDEDCSSLSDLFVAEIREGGNLYWTDTLSVDHLSDIEKVTLRLEQFDLQQNYPNPFNNVTVINYHLPVSSKVTLKVYDFTGRVVETLVDQIQPAGEKSVIFNANGLASGVYIYKLRTDSFEESRKMFILLAD